MKRFLKLINNDEGFYFLRHGQTDFNLNKVFNDFVDVPLNSTGRGQCLLIRKKIRKIKFKTVLFSPLKRTIQTKEMIFNDSNEKKFLMLEELKECSSSVWKKISALEQFNMGKYFKNQFEYEDLDMNLFFNQTFNAMEKIMRTKAPRLVIAHGGVFCAISNILGTNHVTKIDNCTLCYFSIDKGTWNLDFL